MILVRALVRLLAFVLLVVLAAVGLAVAIAAFDPSAVLGFLGLPDLRDVVEGFYDDLEAPGPVALASALAGGGAILLGLVLLVGLLVPRRERLVALDETDHGQLAARRRPLAQIATHLAEQTRGVTDAKTKVKPARRGGGRLRVRADRPRNTQGAEVDQAVSTSLEALTGPFKLKARVRTRVGESGSRVQ